MNVFLKQKIFYGSTRPEGRVGLSKSPVKRGSSSIKKRSLADRFNAGIDAARRLTPSIPRVREMP
ncbi:MAG: hypothetical protein HYV28_16470 [Ignavibacteriales bacterium]|nr:hypothetical protein [Ignavibacteriales bacterium]